jgi:hypothetical protein
MVAVETAPPAFEMHDSLKERVEPGLRVFAASKKVIGVMPGSTPCVTGLKAAEVRATPVSFVDHNIVAACWTWTVPVIARVLPALTLIGKLDVIPTRGLSAVCTDKDTVEVADRVASDTTTLNTDVVAAERSFVKRINFGLRVLVGIAMPQEVETIGAVCTHDQLNFNPAVSPEIPDLSWS